MSENISVLEKKIGYDFNNKRLLIQALTHRSYGAPHNERLEFLGDSLLNFSMAAILYRRLPHFSEGDLSRIRAYFVQQKALARIAHDLELGGFLKLGVGENKSGGWKRDSILSDAVEALLGAVYLDCNQVETVYDIVDRLFKTWLDQTDFEQVGKDSKSCLQEILQKYNLPLPQYTLVKVSGPGHNQKFSVTCRIEKHHILTQGEGSSRKMAERQAATEAYRLLMSHFIKKEKKKT